MLMGRVLRVAIKKEDLDKMTIKKVIFKSDTNNTDLLSIDDSGLKKMPFKVCIGYAIIGVLWVLFSDGILNRLIDSKSIMVKIQSIKGFVFVIISTFIIYFLINEFSKESKIWSHRLKLSHREIQATYDQLRDVQEELRSRYDDLYEKQTIIEENENRYKLVLEGSNDAIWEVDLKTNEFFSSDKFRDITG